MYTREDRLTCLLGRSETQHLTNSQPCEPFIQQFSLKYPPLWWGSPPRSTHFRLHSSCLTNLLDWKPCMKLCLLFDTCLWMRCWVAWYDFTCAPSPVNSSLRNFLLVADTCDSNINQVALHLLRSVGTFAFQNSRQHNATSKPCKMNGRLFCVCTHQTTT